MVPAWLLIVGVIAGVAAGGSLTAWVTRAWARDAYKLMAAAHVDARAAESARREAEETRLRFGDALEKVVGMRS